VEGCDFSAPFYRNCDDCSENHEHRGREFTYLAETLNEMILKIESKYIESPNSSKISQLYTEIKKNFDRLSNLYEEDKREIESKLKAQNEHAGTIELLKMRSTDLTGDNIYQFVKAQEGPSELYANKEAAR